MEKDPTLLELVEWVWRRRVLLVLCALIGAGLFWGASWLFPPIYRAKVVILPAESSGGSSFLSQFAGMAGLSVDVARSPEDVYSTIVTSNSLLETLLKQPTSEEGVFLGQQLAQNLGVNEEDPEVLSSKLRKVLREDVFVFRQDDLSGVMTLEASIPNSAELAARTANTCVSLLDRHMQDAGETKGNQRMSFVKSRLENIQEELQLARNMVTQFNINNREYRDSPELVQKYEELSSEAQALFTVWTGLREQFEMERIDAHGELNSLDILDKAQIPLKPVGPRRSYFLIFGLLLGLAMGVVFASYREARSV